MFSEGQGRWMWAHIDVGDVGMPRITCSGWSAIAWDSNRGRILPFRIRRRFNPGEDTPPSTSPRAGVKVKLNFASCSFRHTWLLTFLLIWLTLVNFHSLFVIRRKPNVDQSIERFKARDLNRPTPPSFFR